MKEILRDTHPGINNMKLYSFYFYYLAHPIHPDGCENPWNVEFLPDCGYKVKIVKGVYQVFKNEDDLNNNKPINYEVTIDPEATLASCEIFFLLILSILDS